jgi:alpha-mannosidase
VPPPTPRPVGIVPHTHWDREWYAPFQAYRLQLLHLVDGLLDLLERDPSYTRFLLDGQTALLDDYLEIRPEAAARIAALVSAGRLQIGPWMVLMDEFMVSGETIVRDLQRGTARAREFGGAMPVGYLPDMFGHVAQLPQILCLAGLTDAVVWRGVPAAVVRTAFWWEAPDGSRVRAEYLYGSYSNGRELPADPAALVARTRNYELELGPVAFDDGAILLMNGSDHLPPQPELGTTVAAANADQRDYVFSITSLPEYLVGQPNRGLPVWRGELRSGARANVLMGVASNRVDVHQTAAAAERALECRAEPLSALFLDASAYPKVLLDVGWRNLVLNSAHDSSCACSADEVVEAVRVRYQEARHVGDALARDALDGLARHVDAPPESVLVVNPTATARGGLITLFLAGDGPAHLVAVDGSCAPGQLVRTHAHQGLSTVVTGRKIRWVAEMMRGPEFAGARAARVEQRRRGDVVDVEVFEAAPGEPVIDLEPTREALLALGESGATIAIRQRRATVREMLFATPRVAGFGWRTFRVVDEAGPDTADGADTSGTAVTVAGTSLANEHVRVEVDNSDGTFAVVADGVRVEGANRYVDSGDGGDTYNFSPPDDDVVVDRPVQVRVRATESGPVRGRLEIAALYQIPRAAVGDERSCSRRTAETVPIELRTTLELRTGERFLRVHVEYENAALDHRLRALFPLPVAVAGSDAECAFAVVHRGLVAEGGPHERGLPTFVSRRFVDCSDGTVGLAVLHDGLLEYEVVDNGRELALTLLRATGYLSRAAPSYRPNPAGPLDPLVGPQLQGPMHADYAVLLHRGDWREARLGDAADEFLVSLEHTRVTAATQRERAAEGAALTVDGARVTAVLREHAGGPLTVRVCNTSPEPSTATVALDGRPARIEIVDLTGRAVGASTGSIDLRPWQIVTLRAS